MSKRTEYRINRCRDFIVLGRKLGETEQNFHITKETYERLRALAEEIWPPGVDLAHPKPDVVG